MEIDGDFERDGAVCVRGAVTPDHVELAREAIDANLADLSPRAKRASAAGDGAFVEDLLMARSARWAGQGRPPAKCSLRSGAKASRVVRRVRARFGPHPQRARAVRSALPDPGAGGATNTDQPYYNVDGRQNASMWFPVDPVPRASTLELVAGSHRGEWHMPRSFLDDEAKWFPDGSLTELPDIDARPDDFRILGWELEPGDAVFFHMLTLHAAGGVSGAHRRRVLSVRFLGDDARHAPRPWPTSPAFPGLADELPTGAPMDHPLFPLLSTHSEVTR